MYYTTGAGKRVYTLKVRAAPPYSDQKRRAARAASAARPAHARRASRRLARSRTRAEARPERPAHRLRPPRCARARLAGRPLWSAPRATPCLSIRTRAHTSPAPPTCQHCSRPAARFSPDDKFSSQRVACKKRFNILPTQRQKHTF